MCDYGENIRRVLVAIAFVFLAFTVLYGLTGIVQENDEDTNANTIYGVTILPWCAAEGEERQPLFSLDSLNKLSLFSLGSMTTMKPDGLRPRCEAMEFVSRTEALFAVALTGLLGFVLGNKVRRK